MSRVEKIRVKSAGLLLVLVLPGAFVEPDEKQLKKFSAR
jgi:membrane-associated protease RseP (regulator of RpoE activity)